MTFTRRLFVLVALGILPLLASAWAPPLALIGAIWNLILVALVLVDYARCPAPAAAIEADRLRTDVLSVAAANTIALRITCRAAQNVAVVIRDEPPVQFPLESTQIREWCATMEPGETRVFEYQVVPPARGDFQFGDVFVRVTSPMKLLARQGAVPAAKNVSVYPNLHAVEDYELMLRRAQLLRQGTRRIRVAGGGREFANLREYTPDDEYRTIDWNATARRGKVISRTFEAERSQDVLLLIDLGRLMRQEIGNTQKLDYVINAALMLAHVVAEADDRIGLLTFADVARTYLPPHRGRAQAGEILKALYAARAEPIETDFRSAFQFLVARWRKRSLVVLFTEMSDPESSSILLAEIAQLALKHLVICVVVSDPLIQERARQDPDTVPHIYEKAVAEEVRSDREKALNLLRRRGVLVVDAEPEELSVELVARYLEVKNRALL